MNEQVIPANAQVIQAQPSVDYNIFIQELTATVRRFELFLSGQEEVRDSNGNPTVVKKSEPKLNQEGRNAVMAWVNTYINPNTYLADNKTHNVENVYRIDNLNVLTMLYMNLNEFELTIENANDIHSKLCQLMFHALQRSISDKKYIFPQIKTNYGGSEPQQERPKIWGLF